LVPAAEPLKGHWYQRAEDAPPAAFSGYVGRVLRGGIRHPWIDRFNRRVVSRRRLVKAIRANLFLGWLADRYPQVKIILLIRHPAAVAQSRLALPAGWEWRPTLTELLEQPKLQQKLSPAQLQLVASAGNPFEEYLLTWSLSHWIPLTELPAGSVLPVFYERLQSAPAAQMKRVFAFLGRRWAPACLAIHAEPSRTARRMNIDANVNGSQEARWAAWLSANQREHMRVVLGTFQLSWLYGDDGYPTKADDETLTHMTDAVR